MAMIADGEERGRFVRASVDCFGSGGTLAAGHRRSWH